MAAAAESWRCGSGRVEALRPCQPRVRGTFRCVQLHAPVARVSTYLAWQDLPGFYRP